MVNFILGSQRREELKVLQVMSKESFPLEQEQIRRLTEIGAYLRHVREDHLLTLEQIATRTMIQARLLRAIESGRLDLLPEPVYIRGFIKRYAEAVGLNGDEIADAFPIQPDFKAVLPSWQESPAAQLRPMHLYSAYIALIIAAISGLSYVLTNSAPDASGVGTTPLPVTPPPGSSMTPAPAQSPAAIASANSTHSDLVNPLDPSLAGKPIRVNVTLTSQSWLRVVVDGRTEFEGILQEGTQRTFAADRELKLRAGNAGGVMFAYNDEQAKTMGEPGTVQQVTFSADETSARLPNSQTAPLPQ